MLINEKRKRISIVRIALLLIIFLRIYNLPLLSEEYSILKPMEPKYISLILLVRNAYSNMGHHEISTPKNPNIIFFINKMNDLCLNKSYITNIGIGIHISM